jgi:pimeloyl-ACP methyl ester carboxylesterase
MSPHALLVHGAGAGGWQWAYWQRVFEAEGWRVSALDLQPCTEGLAATQWSDYLAQVENALLRLPEPRVVIGASLGGLLALAASPAVSARVLVNPIPPAPWAAQLPKRDLSESEVLWHSAGRFESTQRAMKDAQAPDQHFAFRHWRNESSAVLRAAYAGVQVAESESPLLVIASELDADTPLALSAAMAEEFGASLLRVPGGHLAPVIGPGAPAAAGMALTWLNAQLSRS